LYLKPDGSGRLQNLALHKTDIYPKVARYMQHFYSKAFVNNTNLIVVSQIKFYFFLSLNLNSDGSGNLPNLFIHKIEIKLKQGRTL